MRSTLIYEQPQTCVVQSCAAQNRGKFPNVVYHALISIRAPGFGSSSCQKHSFRPTFDLATQPDDLTV
jgi:hypothetical protein